MIDSGITPGMEFAGRIVYNEDFTGGNADDQYGHGGHVAGIIAGDGGNSHCATCNRNLQGIAPAASIVNLRANSSLATRTHHRRNVCFLL